MTTALVSAGLVLGPSIFAQTQTDQQPSTTQDMPSQTQPGRQYQRARLPNPATGNAVEDSAAAQDQSANAGSNDAMVRKADNPETFIKKAAGADQFEIRASQLAQQKTSNQQIKAMADRISSDHQSNYDQLSQIAQQKNVTLADKLPAKLQSQLDQLSTLNGGAFDQKYDHIMIHDHKEDIALFQRAAGYNTDPAVKAFAQSTLPTLQHHLQMAESCATSINEAAGASNGLNK